MHPVGGPSRAEGLARTSATITLCLGLLTASLAEAIVETELRGLLVPPQVTTDPITTFDSLTETLPLGEGIHWVYAYPGLADLRSGVLSAGDTISGSAAFLIRDDWTIVPNDPSLDGTLGFVRFEILLYGVLSQGALDFGPLDAAEGSTSWTLFSPDASPPAFFTGALDIEPGTNGFGAVATASGDTLPRTFAFERPVLFGRATEVEVRLDLDAASNTSDTPPAGALYGTSARAIFLWRGIAELRDESGQPIADYTFTSASGTDWRHPIPEPGVGVALAVGVLGMGSRQLRIAGSRCAARTG